MNAPSAAAGPRAKPSPSALRLGFVALNDAAPLIVAHHRGLFESHSVEVCLSREVGWATLRDKVISGELHAAQALAPMLWSVYHGIESARADVLTALVLSRHGNAITLSSGLWGSVGADLDALRREARQRRGENKLTFGVVFRFSSHHLQLRAWLQAARIDPDRDVRIVVVPPAQMFRNLAAGTIDGYCVGEPWNSVAVAAKVGRVVAWSAAQSPGHVEKVLMVTRQFADRRPEQHAALVGALVEACQWCDQPENRGQLAEMLAQPHFVGQPTSVITPALLGPFAVGPNETADVRDFHVFHTGNATRPLPEEASQLQNELIHHHLLPRAAARPEAPAGLFRTDLFNLLCPDHRHLVSTNV